MGLEQDLMSSSQGQSGRGRRYHVKTRRAFPTRTLSDVILPHLCGRAVRKYVEAMADSQEFTLLSEVLYDVSSHRQRVICSRNHPTPASTRRPLQLIGAKAGPLQLLPLTFNAAGPIATFAGAQAACRYRYRRRAGPAFHYVDREPCLGRVCAALDFHRAATSSAGRHPAAASHRA